MRQGYPRAPCRTARGGVSIAHIGKETNLLDEIQAGLIGVEREVLAEYTDLAHEAWLRLVLPVLRELPVSAVAEATGLGERTLKDLRAGRSRPRPTTRDRLAAFAGGYARDALAAWGIAPPRSDEACLACYLDERAARASRTARCEGCSAELEGKQQRWCTRCRERPRVRGRRSPPGGPLQS